MLCKKYREKIKKSCIKIKTMETYLEYTLEKLVLEKSKQMKYSKLKVHFKKNPQQLGKYPREKILRKFSYAKYLKLKKLY